MNDDTQTAEAAVPSHQNEIRVAIIEDEARIREGLGMLIDLADGFRCIAQFASMEEALEKIGKSPPDSTFPGVVLPDIILLDIELPGMTGIQGIRLLKERHPDLRLVMLTVYSDDDRIFEALCAGATGYLLKKTAPERLLESLKEVMAGGAPMSPEVARRVIALFHHVRPPERADYHLTPHESRLLKMLVEGHTYKTAAAELKSSIHTISFHMRNIYSKLQVHSKSEAVAKALRDRVV
jgi:DNA-binding NarL/FixJ family response regulator